MSKRSQGTRGKAAATVGAPDEEGLARAFEGRAKLDALLKATGTLADAEDVLGAFTEAAKDGVPASVVIQALWEDEPRFESPAQARALFSNLLGLYDLAAAGQAPDLAVPARVEKVKRVKATAPEPFGEAGITDEFVEQAWRFLEDHPREFERHGHAFENRQDALLTWLDAEGLSDAAFGVARHTLFEVFAMLELGGRKVPTVYGEELPQAPGGLPEALEKWIEESVFEAQEAEVTPLSEAEALAVKALITRAAAAMARA